MYQNIFSWQESVFKKLILASYINILFIFKSIFYLKFQQQNHSEYKQKFENTTVVIWGRNNFYFTRKIDWFMMFNATLDNISVISWRSVLLVKKTTNMLQVTNKLLSHKHEK